MSSVVTARRTHRRAAAPHRGACVRGLLALLALVAGCAAGLEGEGDDAGDARDASDLDGGDGAVRRDADPRDVLEGDPVLGPPPASPYERTYVYTLASQAFPNSGHPGAVVHVPPSFDPAGPVGVVVYVHGFNNCVLNAVEATGGPCTPGGSTRNAYDLITQFDAVAPQAVLVLPEVRYDEASGDAGRLGATNGLRNFLEELFAVHLAPVLGAHHVEDLGRVVLVSHSGGYLAVAAMGAVGGVPQVREIDLLDSLYGATASFDGFVMAHLPMLAPGAPPLGGYRFVDVYTSGGGTASNSTAMAGRVEAWLRASGQSAALLRDDTTATLAPGDYARPLIFKRSALSHDGVPRYYFSQLLAASDFAR